nr:MAG TPA: Ras-related protein Rab-27B, Melanophilin, GTP-BINDING PROTEIN, GTPASE, G-PROTEIN [Caudoviricetes sp.]
MSFSAKYCIKCLNAEICKISDILTENQIVNKAMTGCSYYKEMPGNVTIQPQDIVEPKRRTVQDIFNISEKIRELSSDNKEEEEIIKPSEEKTCTVCLKNNIELVKCHSCGEYVCENCCTHTPDGIICDNCY